MKRSTASLLVFTIIAGITSVSFFGYRFGFLATVYNVLIPGAFSTYNVVILSIILATAAFFSPCALTILPAYVSAYLTPRAPAERGRRLTAFALSAAAGVVFVNIIIGLMIAALGAATPFAKDPREDIPLILAVRIIAGFLVAYLGYRTLTGRGFMIEVVNRFISERKLTGPFLYGTLYNAAALGCTGPIMLGLLLYAYATGNTQTALLAFLVFALTMGLLMMILTFLIGSLRVRLASIFSYESTVRTVAGIVMVVTGLSVAILTLQGNQLFVQIFFPFLP